MKRHVMTAGRQAFTLVELLVVIAIIGLLSTIAVAQTASSRLKARIVKGQQFDASIFHGVGDQIVGDWGLEETSGAAISDNSGNGYDGTLSGTLTSTAGVFGKALSFNGLNHITINKQISATLNSFSASVWFKTVRGPGSDEKVLTLGNNLHKITIYSGTFRVCANGDCTAGSKTFNDGEWHLAVITGGAVSIRGYVDGVLQTTQGASSTKVTDTLQIAGLAGAPQFTGSLDQVRLYSASLTAQTIEKHYAEGRRTHPLRLAEK